VAILGSTGSIGRQALDVIRRLPGRFRVVALAGGSNRTLLEDQAREFHPEFVWCQDGTNHMDVKAAAGPRARWAPMDEMAAHDTVDVVLVGTAGSAGLAPTLAALRAGKAVALANKEVLVMAGHIVTAEAERYGGELRPVDSEHSAIWQCLWGEDHATIERLILTASGGAFRDLPQRDLERVTPRDALRHPTWEMGRKITIDSATLMNKGLEVIEARWLFGVPGDRIDVVVHPQSVVHSAVLFRDGSLKAQLGTPDMRLPIQYAITYPRRLPSSAVPADLVAAGQLEFRAADEGRFPALRIAREAGAIGSRATAALISADEVAVARFLEGTLDFSGIPRLLEQAVARYGSGADQAPGVDELLALDREVRDALMAPRSGRRTAPGPAA
jgi:1-deoxy-D-xylulose-5-phosphate reductoisomerase